LEQEFRTLEVRAAEDFKLEDWKGEVIYARSADVRYRGQGYELNLALGKDLLKDFEAEHQRRYGYVHSGREIEIVTLRLRATLRTGDFAFRADSRKRKKSKIKPSSEQVFFAGRKIDTKIYSREELGNSKYAGPAVITEYSATTVVPPGRMFWLDKVGNLLIQNRRLKPQ
jgi:N-methylhydantoinase A